MITVESVEQGDLRMLHVSQVEGPKKRPSLFFFHGVSSAKEHNLHIAYTLAKKGLRVILPDALLHGVREGDVSNETRFLSFWKVVLTSIRELPQMVDFFVSKGLTDGEAISVGGTSMGGITTYGALSAYDWIDSAVSFMGAAQYEQFATNLFQRVEQAGVSISEQSKAETLNQLASFDLSKQPEKLASRPLYVWHGKDDETVPYGFSESFVQEIAPMYAEHDGKLTFFAEEGAGHKISRAAMLDVADWLPAKLDVQSAYSGMGTQNDVH
ncbi:prolyl oligopeptidase family serine peptidase [Shouchella shacheensis]|uniref:prolyl oligopeptidase family serine peptidase n=1 Tax=Shouchella shacheensis TaxID=1649580 RepID=UPI000AF76A72|nr:prolyl oligopeptidase family serine peptidase [Shouchella shacheensis]